jgi:hypothetical protein
VSPPAIGARWAYGRAIALIAALVCLVAAVAGVRQVGAGREALVDSDAAAARGDLAGAVARARDAAEAVVPGSPYPKEGYARLEAIARGAEARGDERTALGAWGAMRAATAATSAAGEGASPWTRLADDGIARAGSRPLLPGHPAGDNAWATQTGEIHASEPLLRASLTRDDLPSPLVLTLLGLGALAFFAGCARLAVTATDRAALRREWIALVAAAFGAAIELAVYLRA